MNRIKEVLKEEGAKGNWLAEQMGVSLNTVSRWCTNKQQPHISQLYKIAELLDVEVRLLLVSSKSCAA